MDDGRRARWTGIGVRTEPNFFISYSRSDAAYVRRLADQLRGAGLAVWFDDSIDPGSRFPQEIREHIKVALAVIVVMSPEAEASPWVEREILEGQRHDREFVPILLLGERFFLLNNINYFNARGGSALFGGREIRLLQKLRDKHSTGRRQDMGFVFEIRTGRRPANTGHPQIGSLLDKLRSFLDQGRVEHADILTTTLLLESVGRLDSGWMRRADGANLEFELLSEVDKAWSASSGGAQGFRRQKELLSLHSGVRDEGRGGMQVDFAALARTFGWRSGQRREENPRYGEFVKAAGTSTGFFPTLRNPQLERYHAWSDRWTTTVVAVHQQLRRWEEAR